MEMSVPFFALIVPYFSLQLMGLKSDKETKAVFWHQYKSKISFGKSNYASKR